MPGGVALFPTDRSDLPGLQCVPLEDALSTAKYAYYTARALEVLLGL